MSVKCGNRKAHNGTTGVHESAGEVRACYAGRLAQEAVAAQADWARKNFSPKWHAERGLPTPVAEEIQKGMEVEFIREVNWLSCGPVAAGKRGLVRTHGSGHSTVEIFQGDRYHYVSCADTNLRPVPESQKFTLQEERTFDDVYAEHEARQERAAHAAKMERAAMEDATDDSGREIRGALRMPTEPMLELIRKLREERGLAPLKFSGTFRQARVEIDRLKALPRVKAATGSAPVKYPTVADGRYALESTGENGERVVKFYRVKRVEKRAEPGRFMTYLDAQASDAWHPVKKIATKLEVLQAIAKDEKAAKLRYGHEIGSCGECGRTLTDETSRTNGIGPICAGKLGW